MRNTSTNSTVVNHNDLLFKNFRDVFLRSINENLFLKNIIMGYTEAAPHVLGHIVVVH